MDAEEAVHAFFTVIRGGHVEEVARLLDADPQLLEARYEEEEEDEEEEDDCTPLMVAAIHRHVGVLRLLLERGADVNASDDMDYTALHHAADEGHEEVVSILLSRGADSSRRSFTGLTALIIASRCGRLGIVRQLLQHTAGRGLDERDYHARTALWWACGRAHVEVARFLLLAGANHTIAGNDGLTPRQAACLPLLEVSGTCSGRLRGHTFGRRIK
jgi:ankyrin repeat protein